MAAKARAGAKKAGLGRRPLGLAHEVPGGHDELADGDAGHDADDTPGGSATRRTESKQRHAEDEEEAAERAAHGVGRQEHGRDGDARRR